MGSNTSVEKPFSTALWGKDSGKESFFMSIAKHEYILVIGDEVILKDEYSSGHAKNYWKSQMQRYSDEIIDGTMSKKTALQEVFKSEKIDDIVNPDLVSLLETRCFPIVITTSIDPVVQTIMQKIYGQHLEVLNIFSSDNRDWKDARNSYEFGDMPTLYYAFGNAHSSESCEFAWRENDMMKALTRWINKESPTNFLKHIWNNKKIFALGCTFSDWYFRFLWYTLRGGVENDGRLKIGNIALTLDDQNEVHHQLINYFKKSLNIPLESDARDFLKRLNQDLLVNDGSARGQNLIENQRVGGVFISYAHEDFDFAERLCYAFRNKGVSVWFDNESLGYVGNKGYEDRICDAMQQAKIFMPILSHQVREDLENEVNERWYMVNEWQKVNADVMCAPVCIEDYSERSNYHQKFVEKVANREKIQKVFVGDKPSSDGKIFSIEEFVNDIKNAIG